MRSTCSTAPDWGAGYGCWQRSRSPRLSSGSWFTWASPSTPSLSSWCATQTIFWHAPARAGRRAGSSAGLPTLVPDPAEGYECAVGLHKPPPPRSAESGRQPANNCVPILCRYVESPTNTHYSHRLSRRDLAEGLDGCQALMPIDGAVSAADATWLRDRFPGPARATASIASARPRLSSPNVRAASCAMPARPCDSGRNRSSPWSPPCRPGAGTANWMRETSPRPFSTRPTRSSGAGASWSTCCAVSRVRAAARPEVPGADHDRDPQDHPKQPARAVSPVFRDPGRVLPGLRAASSSSRASVTPRRRSACSATATRQAPESPGRA